MLLIAALPLSILAGCRDISVGTDTEFYGVPCFNMIVHYGELGFIMGASEWEPVFTLCIYLGNLYNKTLNAGLFLVAYWTLTFAFLSIYLLREKISLSFGVFIYLLLFYNPSLNLMRQSMAMSVCMLSWCFLYKHKLLWCIIFMVLAYFCHHSAVIFAIPIFIYLYLNYTRKKKKKKKNKIKSRTNFTQFVYILAPLFVVLYDIILGVLIRVGIFSDHFNAYVDSDETNFSKTNVLSSLILFLFVVLFAKKSHLEEKFGNYTKIIAYISFILMFSSLVSAWAFRSSYYFLTLFPIIIPMMTQNLKNTSVKQLQMVFNVFLVFLWFWDVVVNGSNSTYPYTSTILEF
ncbi:MAG: EpsG family protein [Prevotellaceae bacterium]|nr:EpsG family protein [Candidatus Minthosoma equi]